jgi:hypothetical protein
MTDVQTVTKAKPKKPTFVLVVDQTKEGRFLDHMLKEAGYTDVPKFVQIDFDKLTPKTTFVIATRCQDKKLYEPVFDKDGVKVGETPIGKIDRFGMPEGINQYRVSDIINVNDHYDDLDERGEGGVNVNSLCNAIAKAAMPAGTQIIPTTRKRDEKGRPASLRITY